jgi:hypothetical protein
MMKTVTLRALVREPRKVKGLTRAGNTVQVTDNGQPLWIIRPAVSQDDEEHRREDLEKELIAIHSKPPSKMSLSKIVLASRR